MAELSESARRDFRAVAADVARTRTPSGTAADSLHQAMVLTANHAMNGPTIGDDDDVIQSALFQLVDAWCEALEALSPKADKFLKSPTRSQRQDLLYKRSSAVRQVHADRETVERVKYLRRMAEQTIADPTMAAAYNKMADDLATQPRP